MTIPGDVFFMPNEVPEQIGSRDRRGDRGGGRAPRLTSGLPSDEARLSSRELVPSNSKRVPTLFCTNASGKRAASAWVALQPVQWVGTR